MRRGIALSLTVLLPLALVLAFQASARFVVLSWSASSSAATDPTGTYNIYRANGVCPATGAPTGLAVIGNTSTLTFTDTSVTPPTTTPISYCYAITFLASSGLESPDSSFVSATLPLPPQPPTNVRETTH